MPDDIASTHYVVLNIGRAKIRFGGAGGVLGTNSIMIRRLFPSVEERSRIWPFSSEKGRFLGQIEFRIG